MIVVDASVALEILVQSETGLHLATRLADHDWHAPHIIDIEVVNALRGLVLGGKVTGTNAERSIQVFRKLAIERHSHSQLLARIWSLRHNLTAYDAAYLALAEQLSAPLVTMDGGLRAAAARRFH